MDKKILFVRNYSNDELIKLTEFTPKYGEVLKIDGTNGLYGLKLLEQIFIEKKMQNDYDYIILVDDDCKILNEEVIYEIIDYIEKNNFDIVGVPDGSYCFNRTHRYDVPNTFFTIIKCNKVRKLNNEEYRKWEVPILRYRDLESSRFESYYKLLTYFNFKLCFNFLKLRVKYSEIDDYSCIPYFNKKDICVHTWWSRQYGKNKEQTDRINKVLK